MNNRVLITNPSFRENHIIIVFDMDDVLIKFNESTDSVSIDFKWYNFLSWLESKNVKLHLCTRGDYKYAISVLFTCRLLTYFKTIRTREMENNIFDAPKSGLIYRQNNPTSWIILIDDHPENGDDYYDLVVTHKNVDETIFTILEFLSSKRSLVKKY